jgi:hypothetical protein
LRLGGGGGDVEEKGHAVCVLRVKVCARGVFFYGPVGGIPAVGVYGSAEGGSLGRPEGGEVRGVASLIGEGGACDEGAVEAGFMLIVFLM